MPQSRVSSNTRPGSLLLGPDGPWCSFLKHLVNQGDFDAEILLDRYHLKPWHGARVPVPDCGTPCGKIFDLPFAQIIDILSDNAVGIRSIITYRQLHDHDQQSTEVARFMSDLRSCDAGVSSRVLVFGSIGVDWYSDLAQYYTIGGEFETGLRIFEAEEDVFISHILGIEYDMEFSSVRHKMGQAGIISEKSQPFFNGLGYTYGDMVFHNPQRVRGEKWLAGSQLVRAYTLGQLKIEDNDVDCSEYTQSSLNWLH